MLVGNARVYPSEAPFRCYTLGLAPDLIHNGNGKACQGQEL